MVHMLPGAQAVALHCRAWHVRASLQYNALHVDVLLCRASITMEYGDMCFRVVHAHAPNMCSISRLNLLLF